MQIHDLNTGTPAATDVLAMDTGSDTYKTTPGNVVPDYTSGDSSTATSWTSVTAVASGLSFSTLIGRITTMMKNVRFLYGLLGTTDISGIGGGTVTGAISTLNSKTTESSGTFSKITSITFNSNNTKLHKTGDIVVFNIDATTSEAIPTGSSGAGFITFPSGFRPASSIEFIGIDATNSAVKGFWVTSNGQIQIAISAIPANAIFRVAGAFSIN